MRYNWQLESWPEFSYDLAGVASLLPKIDQVSGKVAGLIAGLPADLEANALLDLVVIEAVETSEIEGESLLHSDVMSSIKNNLGLNATPELVSDKRAEGVAELMLLAREQFDEPLSEQMLHEWHTLLFKDMAKSGAVSRLKPELVKLALSIGAWRGGTTPMQVVSGRIGNPTIHFEAPASADVPDHMMAFISWFNESRNTLSIPGAVRAAIAHLYFESIHPYEDGNGRIGRTIAEKALSQSMGSPVLMSLSRTINANKKDYYQSLEKAQQSNEVTQWIDYFVNVIYEAQVSAEQEVNFTLQKVKFYRQHDSHLNSRQHKVIERMFKAGAAGFEGGMSAKKYVNITKTSKATATRDLQDLLEKGALVVMGAGRNTHYELNL